MVDARAHGPLAGLKVIELAGIGPVPFAARHLEQMGASIIRIERPFSIDAVIPVERDPANATKQSVTLDLKTKAGKDAFLELLDHADVLLEGHRPGVMEKLGIGPDVCLDRNPRLIFGRMTGWGQTGPWAHRAGHDLNYISITGALNAIGPKGGPPPVPLTLIGDFGGGAPYLIIGVLAAMQERERTGKGQVIDAAIVDGVLHMLGGFYASMETGIWDNERESNFADGGAPYYNIYETSDQRYMTVTAIEPVFYREFIQVLGIDAPAEPEDDKSTWPETRRLIAEVFRTRSQQEWIDIFEGTDACVTPVLDFHEATNNEHILKREALSVSGTSIRSRLAPRFSHWPILSSELADQMSIPGEPSLF